MHDSGAMILLSSRNASHIPQHPSCVSEPHERYDGFPTFLFCLPVTRDLGKPWPVKLSSILYRHPSLVFQTRIWLRALLWPCRLSVELDRSYCFLIHLSISLSGFLISCLGSFLSQPTQNIVPHGHPLPYYLTQHTSLG